MKKITLAFTSLLCALCCAFWLVACDKNDTDSESGADAGNTPSPSAPSNVLKEDTDFSALVSDRVTNDEWKAAFSEEAFSNSTIKLVDHHGTHYRKTQTNEANKYVQILYESSELISFYTIENNKVYFYTNEISDDGTFVRGGGESFDPSSDNWGLSFTMICPDFANYYSEFTYDEETSTYTYIGDGIVTNSILENWNVTYQYASVKIVDGKVAYIACRFGSNNFELFMYDYVTTTVTLPTEFTEYEGE